MRALIFDLDGTLAQIGKGILREDLEILKELEQDFTIALCSGKSTFYLCGFMRQAGLEKPVLIGENGGVIQFGIDLPPKQFYIFPHEGDDRLRRIRELIDEATGGCLWYQPNETMLTPFPPTDEAFEQVQAVLDAHPELLTGFNVYRHIECFDIVPEEINKQNGLRFFSEKTGIALSEMMVFGDGVNDLPMFACAGYSVSIGKDLGTDRSFGTIGEALRWVREEKDTINGYQRNKMG